MMRYGLLIIICLLLCCPSVGQDTSCRLLGATITPLANGLRITLTADGTIETACSTGDLRWYDVERLPFTLPNMRGGGAASMIPVNRYPVSHLEFTPLSDTRDSVGLRCTIVLIRAAHVTAFTGAPYTWDDSWNASRMKPQVMIKRTQQGNELHIMVLSDKPAPPEPLPLSDTRTALVVTGSREALTLQALNADLTEVVSALAEHTGLLILVSPDVHCLVTANLEHLPAARLLAALARAYGLSLTVRGDTYYLFPILTTSAVSYEATAAHMLPLRHLTPADARDLLPDVLRPYLHADAGSGTLTVNGTSEIVEKITHDLRILDQPRPQCMVRAWIISHEAQNTAVHRFLLAVASGNTGASLEDDGDILVSVVNGHPDEVLARIRALERANTIRVDIAPQAVVASGERADLFSGDRVYYWRKTNSTFARIDAGTRLEVSPVTGGEWITLDYQAQDRFLREWNDLGPLVLRRSVGGTIRIHAGDTLIVGGLQLDIRDNARGDSPRRRHAPVSRTALRSRQELWILLQADVLPPVVDHDANRT